MADKVRLIDIAKALNISVTTVSRALNNKSDINAQTKQAVLDLAKKLDYHPNTFAISLRKNRSLNLIGVILPNVDHYFFSTVLQGIMSEAHKNNYLVLVAESTQDPSKEKEILEEFINYGVDGVLLAPSRDSSYEQNLLPIIEQRIPIVLMDRTYSDYTSHYVQSDDYNGAFQAVSLLIKNDYRNIAHIRGSDRWSIGTERYRGYADALKKHGMSVNEEHIVSCVAANKEEGYQAASQLFELTNPPDAVFTVTDDVAAGVIDYCNQANLKIPEQIGVVGFSNSEISALLSPGLTTVEQKGQDIGKVAFEFFLQTLADKTLILQKTFESRLIIRESCGSQLPRS